MRTNPAIRRIVELVADGAIGEVRHITADFGVAGPFPPGHRMRAPALGGGALLDLGVYPVTFAHLFLGPPSTSAPGPRCCRRAPTRTPGWCSATTAAPWRRSTADCVGETGQRATITGTKGRIELPRHFYRPDRFTLIRGTDVTERWTFRCAATAWCTRPRRSCAACARACSRAR